MNSYFQFPARIVACIISILIFTQAGKLSAQIGPPTLTGGIGGLNFTQGELDSDLIAEIVALKQQEIKQELAERLVLQRFECGSFAVYDYVKKTIDILFSEADAEVKKKELLKNSAELAMVVGIAEFFLKELAAGNANPKLLDAYKNNFSINPKDYSDKVDLDQISMSAASNTPAYRTKIPYLPNLDALTKNIPSGRGWSERRGAKNNWIGNLLSTTFKYSGGGNPCGYVKANHIFIDMAFEACRGSEEAKKVGFFVGGLSVPEIAYQAYFSKFFWARKFENANQSMLDTGLKSIKQRIELFFKFHYTISFFRGDQFDTESVKGVIPKLKAKLKTGAEGMSLDFNKNSSLTAQIKKLREHFPLVISKIESKVSEVVGNRGTDLEDLQTIVDLLTVIQIDLDAYSLEGAMYTLKEEVTPSLYQLNILLRGDLAPAIRLSEHLYQAMRLYSLLQLSLDLGNEKVLNFRDFQHLFSLLNRLDEAETYEILLKFLTNLGEIYLSESSKKVLNNIVNTASNYVVVDREQQQIQVNVEAIAVDLFDHYGDHQGNRISLYLSVGTNTAYGNLPLELTPTPSTSSTGLLFVSEKIGLKAKLMDWNRRSSYGLHGIPETSNQRSLIRASRDLKPIVNDLHLVLFGSGLLYQVDWLNSAEENFKVPIIGAGVGLTFYNGLDLNFNLNTPLNENFGNRFFPSISFDIKLTEYLGALRQRQAVNKISKNEG